ncbi:MAG: response regulator, partial [Planctomycetaceae bacterium]|nr:response regulator [Planctomycetaceae bacterium]
MSKLCARKHFAPWIAGTLAFLLCMILTWEFEKSENSRHEEQLRAETMQRLSLIRAKAETAINTRTSLSLGLNAYIQLSPTVFEKPNWFKGYASKIMAATPGILNVALLEATTIKYVYPEKRNQSAIGVNLLDIPWQRDAILKTIQSRELNLAGPLKMVQGGTAFANRFAIYLTDESGKEYFRGMSAVLVDAKVLLNEILSGVPDDLQVCIRGVDGLGEKGAFFYGDESIEELQPIRQEVTFSGGSWQVLAVPKSGWGMASPRTAEIRFLGFMLGGTIGMLIAMLVNSNIRRGETLQALQAASNAKTDFLSRMSHELRTPLTAIRGFARELQELTPDSQSQAFLKIMDRNASHLQAVVNDILDVSRIEANRIELLPQPASPREVIQELVASLQPMARSGDVRLDLNLDPLSDAVQLDTNRFRQVLFNLAGNAIKFTPGGIVSIHVSEKRLDEQTSKLIVRIQDNGVGIAPENHQTIFEPFGMVDASMRRQFGGTGLGLSISRSLCHLMGGDLTVESELGRGACFTASFQVDVISKVTASDNEKSTIEPRSLVTHDPILLVEDGEDNRNLIRYILQKRGAQVIEASNGKEALKLIDEHKVSLIILDMQMPVLDGYET